MSELSFHREDPVLAYLREPCDPLSPPVHVEDYEAALARYFGVAEAIAVSSGTAALHCALSSCELNAGAEVLVPAVSVVMSALPVLHSGGVPIFVDTERDRLDFDYDDLRRKVSGRSRAILPVYMWGCSYDMRRLTAFAAEHGLAIIEDACQAHGSKWNGRLLGTLGRAGCFSTHKGKLVDTGEGGFILTNDTDLAGRCRRFREHGVDRSGGGVAVREVGWNYRLSEVQAIIGMQSLDQLPRSVARRRRQSEHFGGLLGASRRIRPLPAAFDPESNAFSPVLMLDAGLAGHGVAERLASRGVPNSVGTYGLRCLSDWEVFRSNSSQGLGDMGRSRTEFPNATRFLSEVIAPILRPADDEPTLEAMARTVLHVLEEVAATQGGAK